MTAITSLFTILLALAVSLAVVACDEVATSPPATTGAPGPSDIAGSAPTHGPAPTPTSGPPTPTPTPPPTSPYPEDAFPPHIELPPRPAPDLPEPAQPLADALVSIAVHSPESYDSSVSHATGLLVSPDGLVVTVLDYTRNMGRIEVSVPGRDTYEGALRQMDPRTGATLLKIDAANLPVATLGGDQLISPGEPVLVLRQHPDLGESIVLEGFASPTTNEVTPDPFFALLPIGRMGGNGSLVLDRDGGLLGMVGPGQWWGSAIRSGGPFPGPPRPGVKVTGLTSLLEADLAEEASLLPVAISYRGPSRSRVYDSPAARDLLSPPAREALRALGRPEAVERLGQNPRSVLGLEPGTFLELVYPHPQELRAGDGDLLGRVRYVAFWWDREDGEPDVVLSGAEPGRVDAAFLAGDLTELKEAVAAASALGRFMVDFDPLPGYPVGYPLKWQVTPGQETYLPGEEVEFVVTIENQSDWPMAAHPVPPALEVRQVGGPGPGPWWQHLPGNGGQVIPPHEQLTLVVPWAHVDHAGATMPPGEYSVSVIYSSARGTSFGLGGGRFTISEE